MTATQPSPTQTAEPDYAPDEAALLLTERQLRHLAELGEMAMKVARDVTASSKPDGPADLAMARIGKLIMQITVLEQQTAGLRDKQRATVQFQRSQDKKAAVRHAVDAAIAVANPKQDWKQRDTLMRGVFQNYDFSNPLKVAEIVADFCKALGVPFPAEIWPAGDAPAAEEAAAEPVTAAVGPAKPVRTGPRFDRAGVSSAAVMAFAPPLSAKGRDPP